MNKRMLGRTGIEVSEIGFGTWGLGGDKGGAVAYGPRNDDESIQALRRAHELGVNFFDTADLYGMGHSESLLAKVFGRCRQDVVIASKFGFLNADGEQDFSLEHAHKSLNGSLKRLGTDYVDLYQLHSPGLDALRDMDDTLEFLASLKQEGRVRALGLSLRDTNDWNEALSLFPFDAVQLNFNMLDLRPMLSGCFDFCRDMGIGVIARTPLVFGFLSGGLSGQTFADSDHRNRWSQKQRELWASAIHSFEGICTSHPDNTAVQIALRFCLSYDEVSTTIPGMLLESEVEENVKASQFGKLIPEDIAMIEDINSRISFFAGGRK